MVRAGHEPRLDLLGLAGGTDERVDRAFEDVVVDAGYGAELADELGRGREMVRDLARRGFTARFEQRCEIGVAAGPLGLGQRAVGDLADELRLEVELVPVDHEEVPFGQPLEQARRVLPVRECKRRGEPGRCHPRPRSPRAANAPQVRARRVGPRRDRAVSPGDHAGQRLGRLPNAARPARTRRAPRRRTGCRRCVRGAWRRSRRRRNPRTSACTSWVVAARSRGSRCRTNALWRADSGDHLWSKPGTRRREQDQGCVAQPGEQAVGQLEHGLLGPVQIGEPEDEQPTGAHGFEEREGGADAFVSRAGRVDARAGRSLHHVHEAFDEPFTLIRRAVDVFGQDGSARRCRTRVSR